jgi:hypothetical protein
MNTLEKRDSPVWKINQIPPMSQELRLSPLTRNYICKLLRQMDESESAMLLRFKAQLSSDGCTRLNEFLSQLYTVPAELAVVILELDNLVYLHRALDTQTSRYLEYKEQITQIRQQIFQLLGFSAA